MIKVSIIIPVYKVPLEYLRECFDSLLAQTMQECEFIVVSDGAPEAECSVCKEFVAKDTRFKFFPREHAGVSATRNFGIDRAQGEYITFVDSDDWIAPETCEVAYGYAKENDSDVVLFNLVPMEQGGKQRIFEGESIPFLDGKEINHLLSQIILLQNNQFVAAVSTCCKLTKRTIFIENNIRFPESIVTAEDRVVAYRLFSESRKIAYLNKPLYKYNRRGSSVTNTFQQNYLETNIQYLYAIKELDNSRVELLGRAALVLYFSSWKNCYFRPENKDSILRNYQNLRSTACSVKFQDLISQAEIKNFPVIIKQEAWLLKHKVIFPFLFHAIKNLLFKIK